MLCSCRLDFKRFLLGLKLVHSAFILIQFKGFHFYKLEGKKVMISREKFS